MKNKGGKTMKKNNKGFIAISLIYSFFLVFLVTLLMILANYVHNRILLSSVKKETQEYLNGLAEFNPVELENKIYNQGEEVNLASNRWLVLKDNGTEVDLILKETISEMDITNALIAQGISNGYINNTLTMCLNNYHPKYCNYASNSIFNEYRWNTSLVKTVVDYWFENAALLKKARDTGSLREQNFNDGKVTYNDYIRIPTASEAALVNDANTWFLTFSYQANGISYLNVQGTNVEAHSAYKTIRPVIRIKKSS